jgi:sarcosine oxidase, subunit delta
MLLIACPWCGPRSEVEFSYGGPAHVVRPTSPETISDAEWSAYLHTRRNPKGMHLERWRHTHGCRQWFNLARNTVSHEIAAVYRLNEPVPDRIETSAKKDRNA